MKKKILLRIGHNFKCIFLMLLFSGIIFQTFAIEKESLQRLMDENRVLSSASELHLTDDDSAMINSSVYLNYKDAWLFFDNIRPSDVIAKYRSNIFIGETILNPGGNGRVAIYKNGTVIMPHGAAFKPLTVYTNENFSGDSIVLSIETYYNNLGEFDNAIQSFILKRGYQATFANNADGTGYSRVFIADDADKRINMPDLLINKVSFIRVFKHEWVSKKGWCGWDQNEIKMANVTAYYDWNVGGTTTTNYEYSPIRQNGGWPSWNDINSKQNVSHLLGFNEPDRPDQANMQFQDMIDQWPEMLKSGLRIGSPAWSNPWGGNGGNLFDFINKCDELNYRVDFVALHCYWGGKSPQNWYNDLKYIHEQTGRPLWITEWNNGANWTTEWWPNGRGYNDQNAKKQLNDLKGILQVLDTASFVERYFIYNWVEDCRAIILNGGLTLAGEYYAENKSEIAFNNKKAVIPKWNYKNPELDFRYFALRNSMRLSWTNSNGELIDKYILEKKVDDGEYETIYSSNDISQLFYLDPLDSAEAGFITCRLTLLTPRGEHLKSNEVSYFLTSGDNEIQAVNFSLNNLNINTAYFSKRYKSRPLLILGIPSFNNPVPITQEVNNISTSSFMFNLDTWSYLGNPQLTKTDVISTMALPAGIYNLEGLKAEAQPINGVIRDWVAVEFAQNFEKVPALFPTLVSSSNPYPLTVAVRNVTTSGFEICLKSEEAITAYLSPETVNYLAIETGKGIIDGKRISVGRNFDGNKISNTPIEITFDSTYTEPAIFAGLLSADDNFASTMRYSYTGYFSFNLTKQREMSGETTEMNNDDFGWMVMDLAADQPGTGTGIDKVEENRHLNFYPNPAKNTVYFNFIDPTCVEVLDLAGHKLLESVVSKSLDISSINTGIYILVIEGSLPGRLVKIE